MMGLSHPHQTLSISLKVFLPIFSVKLVVIGLAKLDLWLDQFTIVLLYACQIDRLLFMPQAVLALVFIFQIFCFIRIKRQDMNLFNNSFFFKNHHGKSYKLLILFQYILRTLQIDLHLVINLKMWEKIGQISQCAGYVSQTSRYSCLPAM